MKLNYNNQIFDQKLKVAKCGDYIFSIELLDCNGLPDCRITNFGFRALRTRHGKKAMRYMTVEKMKESIEKMLMVNGFTIVGWI